MKQTLAKNVHDPSWTRTYPSNHLSLLLRFLEESISAENVQWEYTIENRKLHFNYYLSLSPSLSSKNEFASRREYYYPERDIKNIQRFIEQLRDRCWATVPRTLRTSTYFPLTTTYLYIY